MASKNFNSENQDILQIEIGGKPLDFNSEEIHFHLNFSCDRNLLMECFVPHLYAWIIVAILKTKIVPLVGGGSVMGIGVAETNPKTIIKTKLMLKSTKAMLRYYTCSEHEKSPIRITF